LIRFRSLFPHLVLSNLRSRRIQSYLPKSASLGAAHFSWQRADPSWINCFITSSSPLAGTLRFSPSPLSKRFTSKNKVLVSPPPLATPTCWRVARRCGDPWLLSRPSFPGALLTLCPDVCIRKRVWAMRVYSVSFLTLYFFFGSFRSILFLFSIPRRSPLVQFYFSDASVQVALLGLALPI